MLTLLVLLGSALALSHDEGSNTVAIAKHTKTIVVTVTQTSMAPLPSDPSLVCPTPSLPCIIDGIAIWPNSTTMPSFTLTPSGDSTAMSLSATSFSQPAASSGSNGATASSSSSSASATDDASTSSSAVSATSSNCSYNMSHILPPEPTSWLKTITRPVDSRSTATNAPQDPEPIPGEENNNEEDDTPRGPDTEPDDEQDSDEDSTSDTEPDKQQNNTENNTPHGSDDHQPTDEKKTASAAMADQPNTHTKRTSTNDALPSFDPIAWASIDKRSETSGAQRGPRPLWSRVFVAGYPQSAAQVHADKDDFSTGNEPENMCVTCEAGGDVVCIGETHYGFCDEGCAEPRVLGRGMRCVDGRVTGVKEWSE
ncbi:hypothetical protein HBI70_190050 [Parastagonospora nodorum]|nr:hypothetical protein HBI79_017690 [Parastagonospora nodorum]KAH4993026.1 hypothetical protein HBI76_039460 [Parastagonospora nodorum]KAH5254724.1 hypothetical protein HBI70_190050 [Parastagonospora nodorum]KAH6023439.1 hypothetical protein HBI83_083710 [Parastagonospora nodorum]KAH6135930.1 hypothetical protein HBI64_044540 [Parastagonospora nodorum]